jgi:glycosyltransferase involved in cell wall biosynthesis
MKPKKIAKQMVYKLPKVGPYITGKQQEVVGLRQAVERLELRNEQWAEEVRTLRGAPQALKIVWPVREQDIVAADWQKPPKVTPRKAHKPPFKITWVIPPMGPISGGHLDIFRTIEYLESQGHHVQIHFYDPLETSSLAAVRENLPNYGAIKAELFYNQTDSIADCDAIFATNWHTAYPVFNYKGSAKKYYFVQDFEPYFDAVGSYSTFAENTYRFGFRGLTLGRWLSEKLSAEYGMKCDYFEQGVNPAHYNLTNPRGARKRILFYARPVTPRRGFELGVAALEIFHKQHPDYVIVFAGWDITPYEVPFPYVNKGILSGAEPLNELYNSCAAGMVLSLTNMSLLPLEMMAAGCSPIVNDAPQTTKVSYNKHIRYAAAQPSTLAQALHEAVSVASPAKQVSELATYAKKFQWNDAYKKINDILIDELS